MNSLPAPTRAPDVVPGDIPGLLIYTVPVTFTAEGIDGERVECMGVVLDAPDPNTTWRVANLTDGVPADLYGDETRDMRLDWFSPLAIYAALHWLADRGHLCLWMLPATHGGRVEAWDELSAWEVSAIVVARSVRRVAAGMGPVISLRDPWCCWDNGVWMRCVGAHKPGYERTFMGVREDNEGRPGWWYGQERGPETGDAGMLAADLAALAAGCALLVPGGLLLPPAP